MRFQRPPQKFGNNQGRKDDSHQRPTHIPIFREPLVHRKSYASMGQNKDGYSDVVADSKPTLVLVNLCILKWDFTLALMGKKGKVYWVRTKEVTGWVLDFNEEDTDSNTSDDEMMGEAFNEMKEEFQNDKNSEEVNDVEKLPESNFVNGGDVDPKIHNVDKSNNVSADPFNIYDMLNKNQGISQFNEKLDNNLQFPLGFSPVEKDVCFDSKENNMEDFQNGTYKKESVTVSNYFVAVKETWIPSLTRLMIILMYAPRELSEKKMFELLESFDRIMGWGGGLVELFPNIAAICLDRYISDHRPILLRESSIDYGPVPFRFFHYWFKVQGFDIMVEEFWKEVSFTDSNAMIRLKKKLQHLKQKIRIWNKDQLGNSDYVDLSNHKEIFKSLQELEHLESMKVAQKAIVKWSIEGDENSKYFHGILNKERSQVAIHGIIVNGEWVDDPAKVKNELLLHFKERFDSPSTFRLTLNDEFPNHIKSSQNEDFESDISHEEIKRAVGSFPRGINSSFNTLIPKKQDAKMVKDFCPISLIGSLYKIIAKILANQLCLVMGDIVSKVQTAFVANRQILNGPFIINELINWCKSKKKETMIFKVDFEKAYDSVQWDYLIDVMKKFGFGDRWCGWIHACLLSSRGSVLMNGSPTEEFHFKKGLKQGDPLSPYLFLLIMESEWNVQNQSNIVQVLKCFYHASALRINLHKSKLMGLCMAPNQVENAASQFVFTTFNSPFTYLCVKVGGLMSRVTTWEDIVQIIMSRLSKWKVKTLSIGGHLTLLKSVLGSTHIYNMSIFKVPMEVLKKMEAIRSHFSMVGTFKKRNIHGLDGIMF
ncbi:RNA-directed DNA polymerase, eukaryota [Tanacetum coccineum]